MNQEEMNAAVKDVVTAFATDNNERAEQVLHQILQAKMTKLVTPPKDEEDAEKDVNPDNPDGELSKDAAKSDE